MWRQQVSETNPTPDELAAEMQENAVAEELGVEPEVIEVPPGVRKGITMFELEDGNFGFIPVTENTTLMDAYALASRILCGINADLVSQKVVEKQAAMAGSLARQAQQQKATRPRIMIPGRRP